MTWGYSSCVTLGAAIRQARAAKRLSQMQVAIALGKSIQAVGQWERDTNTPRRAVAIQLDQLLDAGGTIIEACGYVTQPVADGTALQTLAEQIRLLGAEIETLRAELLAAGALPPPALPEPSRSGRRSKTLR